MTVYFFILSIIFYTQLKHYFLLNVFCDTTWYTPLFWLFGAVWI